MIFDVGKVQYNVGGVNDELLKNDIVTITLILLLRGVRIQMK